MTSSALLATFVERIAADDRAALRSLYVSMRDPVCALLCGALPASQDVRAVLAGTFVEVWWLSRFHTGGDTATWVLTVAARRAAERTRVRAHGVRRLPHDEDDLLTFEWLLGPALTMAYE